MAEDLERIEAELAHLTKALSDLKFNPPVTGRSSKYPFKGQRENCLLLKCRDKRHLDIQVADKVTQPTRHRYLISTVQLRDAALSNFNPAVDVSCKTTHHESQINVT